MSRLSLLVPAALFLTACLVSTGPTKEKECVAREETPVGKAVAKGYEIQYLSGMSPDCRTYRIRNTPGGGTARVRWSRKDELFIEWKLPPCPATAAQCPWKESVTISDFSMKDESVFTFGANVSDNTVKPTAYCEDHKARQQHEKEKKEKPTKLGATLRGTVAPDDRKEVYINITVTSEIDDGAIRYTFEVGKDSERVALLKEFASLEPGLYLRWSAVESEDFLRRLSMEKVKFVGKDTPEASLKLETKNWTIKKGTLGIYQDKELLAATSAPAYVPAKE